MKGPIRRGNKMSIIVGRWERRDNADIAALGDAAFAYCRTVKAQEGVLNSRFFWLSPDRIVVQTEFDSPEAQNRPPAADTTKAMFALSDLARSVDTERWMDPATGQAVYRQAGR
jgi:hypothetical protein